MLVNSTAAAAARQPLPDLGCLCGLTAATLALAARCEAQRQYRCTLLAGVARTAPVRATQLLRLSAGKKNEATRLTCVRSTLRQLAAQLRHIVCRTLLSR